MLQHHDAVSGTAKQAVTFDYQQRLADGFDDCEKVVGAAYSNLAAKDTDDKMPKIKQEFCRLLNITQCDATEKRDSFVVNVFNPLARPVRKFVRLPIVAPGHTVVAPNGKAIQTQVIPVPKQVLGVPGRKSGARFELVFAADVPALGFKSFYVRKNATAAAAQMSKAIVLSRKTVFGNGEARITTDASGNIAKIMSGKKAVVLRQRLAYYEVLHYTLNQSYRS